jgi:hypothetical protein
VLPSGYFGRWREGDFRNGKDSSFGTPFIAPAGALPLKRMDQGNRLPAATAVNPEVGQIRGYH